MNKIKKRSVTSTRSIGGMRVDDLSEEFETVQIIAAKGVLAEFDDDVSIPVIAWAFQARKVREDDRLDYDPDEPVPHFYTRVIGLVAMEDDPSLWEVNSSVLNGKFVRYVID